MRNWEIVLIIVNFGLLYGVLIRRQKAGSTIRSLWPLFLGYTMVAGQIIIEGMSWRMIPAYFTIVLLTVYFYMGRNKVMRRKWSSVATQFVLLTIFLIISLIPPLVFPVFSLPEPTGDYSVGTVDYHWVDKNRTETSGDDSSAKRELMVKIWYPANAETEKPFNYYLDDVPEVRNTLAKQFNLPSFTMNHFDFVQTHSVTDSVLSQVQEPYPVLLFSHGFGVHRNQNIFQVEEFASHGYIVVSIEHTYYAGVTTFPDGRTVELIEKDQDISTAVMDAIMPIWTADASFVLDQLEILNQQDNRFSGKFDLERVGMFGHSFGGANAYQMLMKDKRVKAAIDMDGGLFGEPLPDNGVGKPFFLMTADSTRNGEAVNKLLDSYSDQELIQLMGMNKEALQQYMDELEARFLKSVVGGGLSIVIPNAGHHSFTDSSLYSPLLLTKNENPTYNHQVINEFTLAFFNQHLKSADESILTQLGQKYPEVDFTVNQ
ncbi:dienelactone hydrolase family protein [Hazenella sp. IB182357]|uniref:Dienelactone hydrolase family protein n=1 Tax=Polycladospora coralii TaxID=2771432 RepID=A0A926RTR4_9BACL|nr:dienelactone hydrolase family protein [Polycladospora coralii]MBD1371489.1 dienelactone hydrolase family protein [Polycladospora coralii]